MRSIRSAVLLSALFIIFPGILFAGTGILEIQSEPSGVQIWIDDVEAGKTPYQNLETAAGIHRVKAFLSPEYPPQVQEVEINERSPKTLVFKFLNNNNKKFTGQQIVSATSKYTGSVTFASVPTGALVRINGDPLGQRAPIGYTNVEVGRYRVEFLLRGRILSADFDMIQDKTIKLIADFGAGRVINSTGGPDLQEAPERGDSLQPPKAEEKPSGMPAEKQPGTELSESVATRSTGTVPGIQLPASIASEPKDTRPVPPEGISPYGELVITVIAQRGAPLAYSDYFDILFPKVPVNSLSGPLFPTPSDDDKTATKDNFEYSNLAYGKSRRFSARINFSERDTRLADQAKSTVMTIREGTYDLKVTRQRIKDGFYSVQKVMDETALEAIEIIRGNRLMVDIESRIDEENKLRYEIKRTYMSQGKKKK